MADRSNPPVTFLFPGQGAQHAGMMRSLYESEPRFRETIDHGASLLEAKLGRNFVELLYPGEGADVEALGHELEHTSLAQPAIFVVEYALADLWRSWGVEPAAMIGHSVGEFVAACHAGVFDLESGLELLAARGRLMGDLPAGGMLSVRLPAGELREMMPQTLDLAAVNGPALCVVAGPHEELEAFRADLEKNGEAARPLHTSHAFHSRMMDPAIERFAACFAGIELREPSIPILSTVTGTWLTGAETTDPHYWARHLRETVRFADAVAARGEQDDRQLFLEVEVGPGQTLTGLARQIVDRSAGHVALPSCRHVKEPGSDHGQLLESLGKLWTAGVEVDWDAFYASEERGRVPLPTYPFERKRHWIDPSPLTSATGPVAATDTAAPAPPSATGPVAATDTFAAAPSSATGPVAATDTSAPAPSSATGPVAATFPDMSTNESASRHKSLAAAIRTILEELSGIPQDEMPGNATFLELGFDSLLLTQVSKGLQDEFGCEVTMRQLMADFATIDDMVVHLDATLPPEAYRPDAVPAPGEIVAGPHPQPAAPVAAPAPSLPPLTAPAVPGGTVQAVIDQQLELMRQQLALLQGGAAAAPAPAPIPESAPPPSPVPAKPQPAPVPAKPAPARNADSKTDTSAPTTAIKRDVTETLTEKQQRHLDDLVARYTDRTRTSKELTARYRKVHADPRTVAGFNRLWKEMIYQIVVEKSKGSRLLDIDGNEYIDILNGFGPNFLGHSPDFVTEALREQLDRGVEVGPQCRAAMETAELFCELTGNERASFVNTGSEAVQAAMRLSRTVTGRDKIVVFAKDYHGNFDEVLVRSVGEGERRRSLPIAPGIPRRAVEDVIVLPYGTDESLEVIRSRADELAAVIVEPIQSRRPEFQPKEFIREVRDITQRSGSVFVFDEVITGFRTGPRGAQEYYGVEADIATYGKVVGGGMPIGVVAGKSKYMDTFDGGDWQYGDDSFPEQGVTFFAGTFVRHPLAMVAAREVLRFLRGQPPDFWREIRHRADRLAGTVDRLFVENEAPFRMPNFGSQMFVRTVEDNPWANLLFFHLREKGVFLLEGFPTYMTAAHTDGEVDYVIDAFRESIAELQEAGFFARPTSGSALRLNGARLSGPPPLLSPGGVGEVKKNVTLQAGPAARDPFLHPLTSPLAEIWLASRTSDEATLCFNEGNALELRGELSRDALAKALQDLVERHEALRAVFPEGREGFVIRPEMEIDLPVDDLADYDDATQAFRRDERLDEARTEPFPLGEGPLFRARLLRFAPDDHLLILSAHHLVCDGWSFNVVVDDLAGLYGARLRGEVPQLAPAKPFGDFVIEASEREVRSEGGADETWWTERFAEPPAPLSLPLDHVRPEAPDYRNGTVAEHIDAKALRDLKRAAGKSGSTLFAFLLGTFQTLLYRLSRQERFVVAFPSAGQNNPGQETLVGHCVNFLPLPASVDPDQPFHAFLSDVQRDVLDALDHQDYPYGRLVRRLGAAREGGRRSLIDAVFNLERMDAYEEFAGLDTRIEEVDRLYSGNPLFLKTVESERGLELRFDFQTALFDEATMRHWLASYRAMLEAAAAAPDRTVAEIAASMASWQRRALEDWNDTATAFPRDRTVSELFEAVASERGDAIAVRHAAGQTSYAELASDAARFAHVLSEAGATPGGKGRSLSREVARPDRRPFRNPADGSCLRSHRPRLPGRAHPRHARRLRSHARRHSRSLRGTPAGRSEGGHGGTRRAEGGSRPCPRPAFRGFDRSRLRDLHLGLDGQTEGNRDFPPRHRATRARHELLRLRAGRGDSPGRHGLLRRLGL